MSDLPLIDPDLDDFYEAWGWLCGHPYFHYNKGRSKGEGGFVDSFDVMVVKVDPRSLSITDDPSLNTLTQVWLECGPWTEEDHPMHDYELDVGGNTFEEAICALARRVMREHGDYPEWTICSHCLMHFPSGPRDPHEEWFHSPECEEHGPYRLVTEPIEGSSMVRMVPSDEQFGCEHFPPASS